MKTYVATKDAESASEKKISFPRESLQPLRGLMFLGELEEEVEFGGHIFLIRTLKEGDNLKIGMLTKEYKGTTAEFSAKRLYVVAACIISVDGEPLIAPISPSDNCIYDKANIVKSWYPAVIAYIYEKYVALENSAIEIANSLKK